MLSDLDLNIAASTGIEDLNIADSAYDPVHGFVWAVDTEYGLINPRRAAKRTVIPTAVDNV